MIRLSTGVVTCVKFLKKRDQLLMMRPQKTRSVCSYPVPEYRPETRRFRKCCRYACDRLQCTSPTSSLRGTSTESIRDENFGSLIRCRMEQVETTVLASVRRVFSPSLSRCLKRILINKAKRARWYLGQREPRNDCRISGGSMLRT